MVIIRYLGGKSKIAKDIAKILNLAIGHTHTHTPFVSLFCGTCSIESKVNADIKILNDKHEYLIQMFKGVQSGYQLPDYISKEDYQRIKKNKDDDKVLSGFVGFGCSFGGKWFGGYAQNKTNTNYAAQSKRSLLKDMEGLWNAKFICSDYRNIEIPDNAIIYCDPPYINTTKYSNSNNFNCDEFWDYMRQLSKKHIVFISEQNAPEDFQCIWSKPFKRVLDVNKQNIFEVLEKLYVHNTQYDKVIQIIKCA